MEDLLLNIVREANNQKLLTLRQAAQEAHDLLATQTTLHRTPSHELRSTCFIPLRLALESKRSKLISHALTGLHKIVRDERFQAGTEPEDDSLWLPAQLLYATASMLSHSEDTQVHILRVLLSLACSSCWALNGRLVMLILGRCGEACENGTQPVRAASQAAASQTVRAFTTFLDEEYQEILQQQQKYKTNGAQTDGIINTSAVACFNEAIPVMQYICSRLEETKNCSKSNEMTLFLLECLLTLVASLPQIVHTNNHFTTFLWQRFCPALIALLGAPAEPSAHCLSSQQAKTVYSIGIQLVRLVGCVGTLRPVLEALFHRMVLLPIAVKRLEPLRSIRELLRSPERLIDLLLLPETKDRLISNSDDMAIIRLIMDAIEESALCNDLSVMLASVECVVAMLSSLDALCKGKGITSDAAALTNSRYTQLEQADYRGPLTYQSLARLPKPYRDVVANLRYAAASDSDSSGIDGGPDDHQRLDGDGSCDSDDSSATEGPENENLDNDSDDSIMDDAAFLTSQQLTQVQKLPKVLHLGRSAIDECNVDVERHNAKHFVKTLQNILLPNLLALRSSIQVDEMLQDFASKCCEYNSAQANTVTTIMNADGIYLATYSALMLNLKLIQMDYYESESKQTTQIPLTEEEFVDEVHGSGVLVYLSATWLSELYQHVLASSLLQEAGYDPKNGQQYALINLLTDVGGLNNNKLLIDWQRLERVQGPINAEITPEIEAGVKLSRRVLTCCWDSMVIVLSGALSEPHTNTPLGALGGKASKLGLLIPRRARRIQGKKKIRDNLITSSLDGLHKAASLSNILKLQSRSSSILALLSSAACQASPHKLHAAHALSLDVILAKGLALGSHSADCWSHVFAACVHVARLEHALFSKTGSAQKMLMVAQNANSIVTSTTTADRLNLSFNISGDFENNNSDEHEEKCVDVYSFLQSPSAYSYGGRSGNDVFETSIATIVNKSGAHNTSHGILSNVDAAKVCCLLSQQVDTLFHEAALKLNLPVLCEFLEELCGASQRQLFLYSETTSHNKSTKWWRRSNLMLATLSPSSDASNADANSATIAHSMANNQNNSIASLLLHRIGDVILKCIRAGRPLIHTMHVWSIVGPHLMEAACHKDRIVSKKAITYIHDAVTVLLNEQIELSHFHFNESLLKPFENLLCLELCDADVQDQIVACLCEFVEANRTEIRSGWRPLFGTLRVANNRTANNAASILEVFQVFLSTDNTLVFANAALDCIMCLLAHIRNAIHTGATEKDDESEITSPKFSLKASDSMKRITETTTAFSFLHTSDKSSTGFFDVLETDKNVQTVDKILKSSSDGINLCRESLRLLENCAMILSVMYNMPSCPNFNMSHRIQIDTQSQLVDAIIQDIDVIYFDTDTGQTTYQDFEISYKVLGTYSDLEKCTALRMTLDQMDKANGILRVWYILLEGLASATIVCAKENQPCVMETLFKLLRELINRPGINFGLYCINHLLLPMVQNWLRQQSGTNNTTLWTDGVASNFKQCCGMATELIVEYLHHYDSQRKRDMKTLSVDSEPETNPAVTFALKQLLLILVECVIQPNETVARLGTSCMRHIILACGHIFTTHQWEITVAALHRACSISLNHLNQLSLAFITDSDSFYGDLAVVKVAARRDSSINDNLRLNQLCQQVMLLAAQRESSNACKRCGPITKKTPCEETVNCSLCGGSDGNDSSPTQSQMIIDDRSYVFLLYPLEIPPSSNPETYTVRVPFRNLIVGLLAHQMLIQTIASILLQHLVYVKPVATIVQMTNINRLQETFSNMTASHVHTLTKCLKLSYTRATEFDTRPGLKFLIQKVGNLQCAANLYSQSSTADLIQIIVLTELCLSEFEKRSMTLEQIKEVNENIESDKTSFASVKKYMNDLKYTWETLCDSYMNLSFHIPDDDKDYKLADSDSESNGNRPFKLADFKNTEMESPVEDNSERNTNETELETGKIEPNNMERQADAMLEHYRNRPNNFQIPRSNPFQNTSTTQIPQPQPVPPEIQQQRSYSIRKDREFFKIAKTETLAACLELFSTLPTTSLELLSPILLVGVLTLTNASSDGIRKDAKALLISMENQDQNK